MTDRRNERKEKMIRAALDLVKEGGLQNLTTKNVAARVGVSESSLYNTFKSKQEMIHQTLKWLLDRNHTRAFQAVNERMSEWTSVYDAVQTAVNVFLDSPYKFAEEAMIYEQLLQGDLETVRMLEEKHRNGMEEFSELIRKLTVRFNMNIDRYPLAAYELMMLVLGHLMFSCVYNQNPKSRDEQNQRFQAIVENWTARLAVATVPEGAK